MTRTNNRVPAPREIAESLEAAVIGQREAVQEIAVAVAKRLARLPAGNVLLIGASGTGKTTLMRAVEQYLATSTDVEARPTVLRLHANVLGQEAEKGRPGQVVLRGLLERAREQAPIDTELDVLLTQAAQGLVFVDEVDKIRSSIGGEVNTSGIRAQEALLTLMENESVLFELPQWAGGGAVRVDSSGLLFVCAGAFEGLYDAVFDRVTVGSDRGALQPVTIVEGAEVREELPFRLRDWLRSEDLFDYGIGPQFLSRFGAVVLLEALTVDDLVRIFLEAPDSAYRLAQRYFANYSVQLAMSPAAVRRLAEAASARPRVGARALREVFNRVLRPFEIDPVGAASGGDGSSLLIDTADVEAALGRELGEGR